MDINGNYLMLSYSSSSEEENEFLFQAKPSVHTTGKTKFIWKIDLINRTITNKFYAVQLYWQVKPEPIVYVFNEDNFENQNPNFYSLPLIPFINSYISFQDPENGTIYFLQNDSGEISLTSTQKTNKCIWRLVFA